MMRLPVFRFHRPESVDEVLELLNNATVETRLVAGGTDLWPNMKRRHQSAEVVVSLGRVAELVSIGEGDDGALHIGAMTPLSVVASSPLVRASHPALARAAGSVSSPAIRNVATLGGNLCLDTRCTYYNQNEEWRTAIGFCMKEGGETCWVAPQSPRCWAISASDTAPVLCALDAQVRLVSTEGERTISVRELFADDGMAYLTIRPGELLAEVVIPAAGRLETSFWKLRRRASIDFAVLSVAVAVARADDGIVRDARVWLGAVASRPVASAAAREALLDNLLSEDVIRQAARAARRVATPLDNTDFTLQWRSKMVVSYVEAALREIAGLPQERLSPKHDLSVFP